MKLQNLIFGIAITTLLLLAVVVTRLFKFESKEKDITLVPIKTLTLTPPPEPKFDKPIEQTPPPTPSIVLPTNPTEIEELSVPISLKAKLPTFEIDLFTEDIAPADLPNQTPPSQKRTHRAQVSSLPKIIQTQKIGINDLDKTPQLIREGRFRWPNNAKEQEVSVRVHIEINEQGYLRLLDIKSIPNPIYKETIRQFVRTARFTPPCIDGNPIKVDYILPITLRKK